MKEHFSSRVTKLLVILALAIVASVMFVIVGCDGGEKEPTHTVHSWVADSSKTNIAPTCTTDGVDYFICSECGMTSTEPVPATGHTWDSDGTKGKPATCTEDGWYFYRECTKCGYVDASDRMPATGHMLDYTTATKNLPTCTADGSLTGTCANGCGETITIEADKIVFNGEGKNVDNYPGSRAEAIKDQPADEEWYSNQENVPNEGFLQTLGHVEEFGNTHDCVAIAELNDVDAEGNVTAQYWNRCERCDAKLPLQAHEMPKDAVPCVQGEGLAAGYAYVCEDCEQPVKIDSHDTALMIRHVDELGYVTWEAAPEGATLSCKYWVKCKDCDYYALADAHETVDEITGEFAATCEHGAICPNCYDPENGIVYYVTTALPHDDLGKDGVFDNHTGNTKATCTEAGHSYTYCTMCKAREEAGEDVEWVKGENYTDTVTDALEHRYATDKVSRISGQAMSCVTGYYNQDKCLTCGAVRKNVKPTFTDKSGKELTEAQFEAAAKVYVNGQEVSKDTYHWDEIKVTIRPAEGDVYTEYRSYTDANGNYGGEAGKNHTWKLLLLDYANDPQLKSQWKQVTCTTKGKYAFECAVDGCEMDGVQSWREVTLDQYVEYYIAASGDEDITREDLLNDKTYHSGTMLTCGHGVCSSCNTGLHNEQYYTTFDVVLDKVYEDLTAPTIDKFSGYTCREYTENNAKWEAFLDALAANVNYTYTFYKTAADRAAGTNAITIDQLKSDAAFIDGVTPNINKNTLYVVATPVAAYTVNFVLTYAPEVLQSNEMFVETFAPITVYKAEESPKVTAPTYGSYVYKFYEANADGTYKLVDGNKVEFKFANADWSEITADIYLIVEVATA